MFLRMVKWLLRQTLRMAISLGHGFRALGVQMVAEAPMIFGLGAAALAGWLVAVGSQPKLAPGIVIQQTPFLTPWSGLFMGVLVFGAVLWFIRSRSGGLREEVGERLQRMEDKIDRTHDLVREFNSGPSGVSVPRPAVPGATGSAGPTDTDHNKAIPGVPMNVEALTANVVAIAHDAQVTVQTRPSRWQRFRGWIETP
jgi:hypothetical protein